MQRNRGLFSNLFIKGLIICLLLLMFMISEHPQKHTDKAVKEIEFWTLQLTGFSEYINGVIANYERLHPDVKIKWVDVPFSEGEKRALASVLSKNAPDLINMNPDFGTTLASKGALTDIKPLVKQNDYDNYLKIAWKASSLDDFVFGVPWYITSAVTFYNTEIINENLPKTYTDLNKIAGTIKENTGKYVLMPTLTENGKMLQFFNKEGITLIKDNKTVFNTPKAQEILSFWKNMYDKEFIPKESITETHREALGKFQSGEMAFIVAGANFAKIIKQNSPQLYKKLDVLPQLTGSADKADFSLMNLVIPKKSKHPKIALDFALFLTNQQNQLAFCKLAPLIPSEIHALESEFFTAEAMKDLIIKSKLISANQLKDALSPIPPMKNRKELYEIIDYMTQEVMLGKQSPKQALNKAVFEWDKVLEEN